MSIDPTSCTSLAVPPNTTFLLCVCVSLGGTILGLGLALIVMVLCTQSQRRKQRKYWMEQEAAQIQHKREQEAVLAQCQQEQGAIDRAMDARLDCSACWQERHPGIHFPLPKLRFCDDHTNRYMPEKTGKATSAYGSQQQLVHHLSSVNESLLVEGTFA